MQNQTPSIQRQLEVILESITDAFYALDENWRFTYFNAEAERILKRERSKVLGRCVWDAFPQTKGSELEKIYQEVLTSGTSEELEYFYSPLNA